MALVAGAVFNKKKKKYIFKPFKIPNFKHLTIKKLLNQNSN